MRTALVEHCESNGTALPEWTLIPREEEARFGLRDSGCSTATPVEGGMLSLTSSSTSLTGLLFMSLSSLGAALLKTSLSVFMLLFYITFLGFLLFASVASAILGLITCPIWAPPVLLWRRWLLNRGASTNGT